MSATPDDAATGWQVRGTVRRAGGEPAAGLLVRVVRRSLRAEAAAGEARTGPDGRYRLTVEAGRPALVRAVGDAGETLAEAALPGDGTVDLVLPEDRTEYERAGAAVGPLLDGVEPADLAPADVDLLTGATGLPRAAIAAYAAGGRLARERGLEPELAYAVARTGGPDGAERILDGSADLRRYAMDAAVAGRVVSPAAVEALRARPDPAAGETGGIAADLPRLARLLDRLVADGELGGDRDLVRLDEAGWAALLDRTVDGAPVGTPPAFQRAYGAGAAAAYARELVRRAGAAFPSAAIAHRLERSDLPGAGDLARFLSRHPDFDLFELPAHGYLADHASALDGLSEPGRLPDRLAALQRVARLAPGFEQIEAMLHDGLDSAWRITQHSRAAFTGRLASRLGGREAAEAVYDRAEDTASLALAVHVNLGAAFATPGLRGLGPAPRRDAPDWEELFGAVAFCSCRDCRSVLSPAAYLVDLLAWLRPRPSTITGRSALDVLLGRRPDLRTLELSCENTNTALPAVDIALEIMEGAIAPAAEPRHDTTTGATDDLVALPEHVNLAAYRTLGASVFPWTLPYDLNRDAARTYLGQFGVRRADLMATFAPDPAPDETALAIAAEELGVPPLEALVLSAGSGRPTAELWGVTDLAALRQGSVLLRQSGLAYEELAELVSTRFVEALAPVRLEQRGERCDPAELVVAPLGEPVLAGMARFVRLRRALGWSAAELDSALVLARALPPLEQLLWLVDVERLRRDLRLPTHRLLALFGDLDTHRPAGGEPSPYERVYLDPALTRPGADPDPGLALRQDGTPAGEGEPIGAHAPAVAAALGIGRDELAALVGGAGPLAVEDRLALGTLSALFRIVTAARALRLPAADLVTLAELAGADPFTGPGAFRTFVARARALRAAGIAVPDLDWLLTGRGAELSRWPLPAERAGELLRDLRAGLAPFRTSDPAAPWAEGADDLAAQTVAGALDLDPEAAAALLTRWVRTPDGEPAIDALRIEPGAAAAPAGASAALDGLARAAALAGLTGAGPDDLRWLFGAHPGWSDLNLLPVAAAAGGAGAELARLERTVAGFALRDALPGALDVFAAALDPAADAATVLRDRTGWDPDDVAAAGGADLADERSLERLRAALALASRLGVRAATAAGWAAPELDETAPAAIVRALRARYGAEQWPQVAAPLRNALRERQRAACVAHLLHAQGLASAEDLYDRFLIDVETSPCQLTSRIRQAASSVQLFVQRCLLGREPVVLDQDAADEWEWMSRYRVWEANRKVLLFPENWIEPDLRDDASPLYEELADALLQDDVTDRTASDALATYLRGLDEIGRLDVRAVCTEVTHEADKSAVETVHVVARTPAEPFVYHYRRRVTWNLRYRGEAAPLYWWTPWERVGLDIKGDHLMAFVHDHRLYLFWPLFADRADEDERQDLGAGGPARRHLEVQMAWSQYREAASGEGRGRHRPGTWSPKQTSTGGPVIARPRLALPAPGNPRQPQPQPAPELMTFRVREEPDQLVIDCYLLEGTHAERPGLLHTPARLVGRFVLPECGGGLVAQERYDPAEDPANPQGWVTAPDDLGGLPRALPEGQRLAEDTVQASVPAGDDALYLSDSYALVPQAGGETTRATWTGRVLELTPGSFHLAAAEQDAGSIGDDVLVFEDGRARSFFVERVAERFPFRGGYLFTTFYHPYVCDFVAAFNRDGLDGLYGWTPGGASVQTGRSPDGWFAGTYRPVTSAVAAPLPAEEVDFTVGTPYGVYNWELFFHVPLLVATRLSANQRFEDAHRWFHRLFDPRDQSERDAPGRYWRVLPFVRHTGASIETLLDLLARLVVQHQVPQLTQQERRDLGMFALSVAMWRDRPFEPHLLARMRPAAYQRNVVIRYVENLVAWADSLFRQDTIESIGEATQLYLLAADVLGPRPPSIPGGERPAGSWDEVSERLDDLSNPLVRLENAITLPRPVPSPPTVPRPRPRPRPPVRLHYGFLFCIPRNDRLDGLWDTIADRLAKIRMCRNIDGVERRLPLFDPPIDPGLLVRAVAAGVDIGAVVAGQAARPLPYRFPVVLAKAIELAGEVRSLGALLLSVLEKRDAEALALLRAGQEARLLDAVRAVRERQVEETQDAIEALGRARAIAQTRRDHYRGLQYLNASEQLHLQSLAVALGLQLAGQAADLSASTAFSAPSVIAGSAGLSSSPVSLVVTGGSEAGSALQSFSRALAMLAGASTTTASMAVAAGAQQRRAEDWALQVQVAQAEMDHVDAQVVEAQVRLAIAENELRNHDLQVENAGAAEDLLRAKFTNRELYGWMAGQAAAVHYQAYQVAFDLARRAEAAYAFELGLDPTGVAFVSFGSWDSTRKGLLAGERLAGDLRRMEVAHLQRNERDLEITRHVSLAMVDPVQLIQLRNEGTCTFTLPESLFDADFPGHYLRRIRSVGVSIPCVTGPYTTVNATLRLQASSVRFGPDADPDPANPQLRALLGPSRPIALGGGVDDAGLFELNPRDDRYLPFEGQGAIGTWRLDLPRETNRFDLGTISDVVLHLRYTAREGSDALRQQALETLNVAAGVRLFSARHEFPDQWHRFLHPEPGADHAVLALPLTADRLPYAPGAPERAITGVRLIVLPAEGGRFGAGVAITAELTPPGGGPAGASLTTTLTAVALPGRSADLGQWTLRVALADIPRALRAPGTGPRPLDPAVVRDIGVLCDYAAV